MSVMLDTTTESDSGATAVSILSFSHTTTVSADRLMLIAVFYPAPIANYVTSVTYNGVPATKVDSAQANPGNNLGRAVELWKLVAPATGANTVVVNTSSANSNLIAVSATFAGVSQTTALGTSAHNTSTSATSLSATTTGSTSNDLVYGVAHTRSTGTSGVGSGMTRQFTYSIQTNELCFGSTQAGASSVTSTFTQSGAADNFACIAVPIFNDLPAPALSTNFFAAA